MRSSFFPGVTLRRALAPVVWGLRADWGTAALLGATAATALAALLPVTSLAPARLGLAPWRGGDLGMTWSPSAWSPTATQQAALVTLFRLLLGVAAGVLAVAGLTIISLSAARASARASEVRVRRAVGASQRQLVAAALCESGAIAAAALLLGGIVGALGAHFAIAAWEGTLGLATAGPNRVAIVATLAGIVFGAVLPLAFPGRTSPLPGPTGKPLELTVPALQLGLSLTVLAGAALLGREASRFRVPGSTLAATNVVFELRGPAASPATRAASYASLLHRLEADHTVSLTSPGALLGLGMVDWVTTDCGACAIDGVGVAWRSIPATHYLVSADTFRVLGLGLAAGRGFTAADRWGAAPVAVVNRHLAARYFQQGEAVGRQMLVGRGAWTWYNVIGVVDDQQPTGFGGGLEPPDAVYLSVLQHPARSVDLLVRSTAGGDALAAVRHGLESTRGADTAVAPASAPLSVARLVAREAAPLRWFAGTFRAEGWILLTLATLGTFIVMRLWIASLRYELGVRRATGARRWDIMRFVLWRAMGVAIAGVAIGLWIGLLVWGTLAEVVAGLPEWDARTAWRFAPLLAAAALAGALLPAWRAARAAPTTLIDGAPS